MENNMKRASSLAILLAAMTLVAAPAMAKPTLQAGKNACTAAAKKQAPAPKSVRIDDNGTRITTDAFIYRLKVKNADDSSATTICTFNVDTSAASLAPAE
jgi:hypothetical protein